MDEAELRAWARRVRVAIRELMDDTDDEEGMGTVWTVDPALVQALSALADELRVDD